MSLTLKEQLSNLPVPRLTTVLRVDFVLQNGGSPFEIASGIIEEWWNEKATPYDALIGHDTKDLTFSRSGFKIEFSRNEQAFALSMEEPDSSFPDRSWIVDVALKLEHGNVSFGLRHSFRQPYNATSVPEPRSPRFLRRIVDEIGVVDEWALSSEPQQVGSDGLPFFLDLLESERRTLPVLAISEDVPTGAAFADPYKLARFLSGTAHIFRLDRDASWDLSRRWGNDWSVFQGAIRCYLPQVDREGDKFKHRLWLPASIERLDANLRNGFLNAAVSYVFTQITAQFEAWPLVTPSVVRRQIEEASRKAGPPQAPPIQFGRRATDKIGPSVDEQTGIAGALSIGHADPLVEKLEELQRLNDDLLKRIERQEEAALKLENNLEQERAGRAGTERALGDTKAELDLVTEVNQQLEQQRAIAFGDVSKEQSEALRPLWQNFSGLFTAVQTVAIKFRRMEQDSDKIYELEQKLTQSSQDLLNRNATIDSLNRRKLDQNCDDASIGTNFRTELSEIIPRLVKKQVSLLVILETLSIVFLDRVTVLESAFDSAKASSNFLHVEQAFDLLWCLATEYWEQIQNKGDAEARKLFGKSYAANEKSALSKSGKDRRTFAYGEQRMQMDKHLKIGTADNAADTLRIHFEWIADEKRIVIGHCGRHLPF